MKKLNAIILALLGLFDLRDALFFCGLGTVAYGVHEIYPPAAWIITGAVLLTHVGVRR